MRSLLFVCGLVVVLAAGFAPRDTAFVVAVVIGFYQIIVAMVL